MPGVADVILGETIHAELADPKIWEPQKFEKALVDAGASVKEVVKP